MTEQKPNYKMFLEANEAFYKWEQDHYHGDSPLSDDDRIVWMQGYVYALFQRGVK